MDDIQRHIDPYDTGQWHLTVYFSRRRAVASLKHLSELSAKRRTFFDVRWDSEGKELLKRIESTVYENPSVLDDYSADIVIAAADTIFVPSEIHDESAAENCYTSVYRGADPDDILSETDNDLTALSVGAPGLKAFLGRTFPGARISSSSMAFLRKFRNLPGSGPRVYIHAEDRETQVIALEGRKLLCSAIHDTPTPADAFYAAMLTFRAYSLDPTVTEVSVSGDKKTVAELTGLLRDHVNYVVHTMLPIVHDSENLPLAAILAERRTTNPQR